MIRLASLPVLLLLEALPVLLFADIVEWAQWKTAAVLIAEGALTVAVVRKSRSAATTLALVFGFVAFMMSYAAGTGALSGWPL